jgi:hypothetical protein
MTTVLPQGSRPTARVSCGPRSGSRTTGRVNGMTAVDEVSGEGRTGACRVLVVKRCDHGAHYGFGRLVRGGWVSVRRGPGEEHQTELAHLNLVAVG